MHLFVSDLHLDAERPHITALFEQFLAGPARSAQSLYILGDLFEAWIGDDDDDPHHARVIQALAALTAAGTPAYVMHGNRDFLLGERFCQRTGLTLLDDPCSLTLFGRPLVLAHGDSLCTDDEHYQQIRQMLRSEAWQAEFLGKPLQERRAFAQAARQESQRYIASAQESLMDVNQQAVTQAMQDAGCEILIHGHTHRPAIHDVQLGDRRGQRIVLGDWYEQGSVLVASDGQFDLQILPVPRA